jgi:RND family efflux transporter MFP subunit
LLKLLIWLVVFAAVTGGGLFIAQKSGWLPDAARWFQLPEALQSKPEVQTAVVSVERGRAADATVRATGYLESRQQARIGARATGRIQEVRVEEGSKVQANDVLAVLEHADLDAALAAAKASVARARSELLEQDVEIARTQREYERAEKALATKSMTPADYDTALFARDATKARKESMLAALELAEARVREAEQLRENMFVRAPFAGTVISKDAELGESIMPGGMGEASGRGSVVTIADLEHLEVDCDVKEDFIGRVSEGQAAEVSVDAVPDRRYKGRVRKIIPMGDRARATVKVKVEILDADSRLFPDMGSTVFFLPTAEASETESNQSRVFCPALALISEGDATFVLMVGPENRIQKLAVDVAETRDDRAVIASGLKGGEKVVISPPEGLKEGTLVRIAQ